MSLGGKIEKISSYKMLCCFNWSFILLTYMDREEFIGQEGRLIIKC